jgi:hypothetical protein
MGEEEERELLREIVPDRDPEKIDVAQRMLGALVAMRQLRLRHQQQGPDQAACALYAMRRGGLQGGE